MYINLEDIIIIMRSPLKKLKKRLMNTIELQNIAASEKQSGEHIWF